MAVQLKVPFSERTIEVADEDADRWRSVGYRDVKKAPAEKPAAKTTTAKGKSDG
jgi:hypothetical protein